jgi:hypothetical protein
MSKLDLWLKRLWLVNGIFVLLAALSIVYETWLEDLLRGSRWREPESGPIVGELLKQSQQQGMSLQEVEFVLPRPIHDSEYSYIKISEVDLKVPENLPVSEGPQAMLDLPVPEFYGRWASEELGAVNLLFFKGDFQDAHLLLDRRAYVAVIDVPTPKDSLQSVILYELVVADTNGDGRLNALDRRELYVSDLVGRNLRWVPTDGLRVLDWEWNRPHTRLYLEAKRIPEDPDVREEHWDRVLLMYDPATDRLEMPAKGVELLAEAKRLLQQ